MFIILLIFNVGVNKKNKVRRLYNICEKMIYNLEY